MCTIEHLPFSPILLQHVHRYTYNIRRIVVTLVLPPKRVYRLWCGGKKSPRHSPPHRFPPIEFSRSYLFRAGLQLPRCSSLIIIIIRGRKFPGGPLDEGTAAAGAHDDDGCSAPCAHCFRIHRRGTRNGDLAYRQSSERVYYNVMV